MIEPPNYRRATNEAYEILKYYEYEFPRTDIEFIITFYLFGSVKICSYSEAAKKMGITHNEFTYSTASSEQGFTILNTKSDKYIIYYNDWKDDRTIRFTLAHELGHIVLNHKDDNEITDKEANCFARNLLCPVPVIDGLKLSTPEEYVKLFDVSMPMAKTSVAFHNSDFKALLYITYQKIYINVLIIKYVVIGQAIQI